MISCGSAAAQRASDSRQAMSSGAVLKLTMRMEITLSSSPLSSPLPSGEGKLSPSVVPPSPEEPALSAAKGRGGQGVRTLGGLEETRDGDELPIHRIRSEAELFERDHAKDRLGAGFAEYDDRRLDAAAHPDVDPRHRVEDLTSVRQHERPLVLRHDAQAFQDVPGNPGVGRAGVHCVLDTGLCVWLESTLGEESSVFSCLGAIFG